MYDAAIIGAGPAGLSAALTLSLHEKSLIWFGAGGRSEKVQRSEKIANYPGTGLVSGEELNRRFEEHAAALGLAVQDTLVTSVIAMGESFTLLAGNDVYEARTLLLAGGAVTAKGIPGEQELLGRGVSYCATCDGFLYKGKTLAVICSDRRYEHEAVYLSELAERVYLSTPYKAPGVDRPNVTVLDSPIVRVEGEGGRVSAVALRDGQSLPVNALFCLRSSVAPATLLPGLTMDGPHIVVDRSMATGIPGCFAAGDCTGRPYQIAKAVGEGNVAAHSMVALLAKG